MQRFYASENQNQSKKQTKNKTHQHKNFLNQFYTSYAESFQLPSTV